METPLQKQLNGLGNLISKAALWISIILFVILLGKYLITEGYLDKSVLDIVEDVLSWVMICITMVCVIAPEGLPLASTLSLAFSMKAMAKENNLVRKLHASDTIGAVNLIMTDKTGTLTQNKMTVVGKHLGNSESALIANACLNSSAHINTKGETIGNPTEGAILKYMVSRGHDYKNYRNIAEIVSVQPFNSGNKYMSTTVLENGSEIVYLKGAPEVVASICGDSSFLAEVSEQQARGRRAISFVSGPDMQNLVYDGTCFIEDPVRPDVPEAVKQCYEAGIDVVMVTGDNIQTASEIGRQAGFSMALQGQPEKDVWAVEAKDFDKVAWGDPFCGHPNVSSRNTSTNKLETLKLFQKMGYIVAGTGDGTNDGEFLAQSNVGVAMGSGTAVARQASDIILIDDSFKSIVTGIKWGRSLYKNIQSFLTFQLTINVAMCLLMLISPILGSEVPFTVLHALWINLVMDTLACICLATEGVDENVMKDKPRKESDFIISKKMYETIFGFGITVALFLAIIVFDISQGSKWFGLDRTEVFTLFLVINWWQLFNIRVFGKGHSIFHNITKNKYFLLGSAVILIGTILIVQLGGEVFSTRPLDLKEWLIILGVTSPIVIVRELWFRLKKAMTK